MDFVEGPSCAITGHRPEKLPWGYDETSEGCRRLRKTLTEQIVTLADSGVTSFLSGMALGVDQIFAELVLAERKKNPALKLLCVLPHEGQADKWSDSARERYHAILKQANSVDYISREYYDGCMIDRNHRMVDSAGLLLAVYNGVRRSGTGATVNYARKMGREIIVIDPITLSVSHEGGGV